ncbi:hypothetical protein C7999DRAFT_41841 [Corynascus novoguineensis]|uniref:Uncharacterized protein n=1 Tax=Corynascus novoguineensis TaxID=1126955 RepID=A0AAN7CRN7_9PEZI|nr:hypothetical protein C7999DRAFT_41841 [Corynascus novoguineensis]
MVASLTHVSSIKGAPRLRPCGSKTKITQAIASNDWRKREVAASSPEVSTKINKQSCDPSDDICIRVDCETDESFSGPRYRFPKEKKVAWESTVSAPVWQLFSSSSSVSGDDARDAINVRLKQVNPILTNVNGETIALPNRFSFDVVAINQDKASPGCVVGELRRLNGPATFRRLSSQDSDNFLMELRELLNGNWDVGSPVTSTSSKFRDDIQDLKAEQNHGGASSGDSELSVSEVRPGNEPAAESNDEEEVRFQRMLNRLQNNRQHSSLTPKHSVAATPSRSILDPAIMALKVKSETDDLGRTTQPEPDKEAANTFFAQQLTQMRNVERHKSNDSGYRVARGQRNTDDRSEAGGRNEPRLNPAAAKFKSAAQSDVAPWMSPKKMSRPPLTNIFPDAMPSQPPTQDALSKGCLPSQPSQPTIASTAATNLPELRLVDDGSCPEAQLSRPHPVPRPVELPINGTILNGLPVNTHAGQAIPPGGLAATMSAATAALPQSHATVNLQTFNGFNTFPPTTGLQVPLLAPNATSGINLCPPSTVSFVPVPQLAMGPDGKPARPYFPVTTKPRDHDPVKQQLYEAYLEWRKANEPGYHMKCKMRQANRVMRQYHQQQDATLARDPANWKAIAEKAKAAVGAAAAAAAEEKKRREQLVKEEMKAKVRELSQGSQGAVHVGA